MHILPGIQLFPSVRVLSCYSTWRGYHSLLFFNPAQTNPMHFFSLLQVLAMCLELILTLHEYFLVPCMLMFKGDSQTRLLIPQNKAAGGNIIWTNVTVCGFMSHLITCALDSSTVKATWTLSSVWTTHYLVARELSFL